MHFSNFFENAVPCIQKFENAHLNKQFHLEKKIIAKKDHLQYSIKNSNIDRLFDGSI